MPLFKQEFTVDVQREQAEIQQMMQARTSLQRRSKKDKEKDKEKGAKGGDDSGKRGWGLNGLKSLGNVSLFGVGRKSGVS